MFGNDPFKIDFREADLSWLAGESAVGSDGSEWFGMAQNCSEWLNTDQIDYVNAHGTSTMADVIELGAVKKTFGQDAYTFPQGPALSGHRHSRGLMCVYVWPWAATCGHVLSCAVVCGRVCDRLCYGVACAQMPRG